MEAMYLSIGFLVGGIITFFVGKHYYNRTDKELRDEVARLQQLNARLLRRMEEAGLIRWNRDSQGNATGLDINSKSSSKATEERGKGRTLH